MSTIASPTPVRPRATTHRLTFGHLLRSESIKILSLRSTWWSLGITAALSIGISFLIATASRDMSSPFPATSVIVSPTQFTMLVAGILGAIVVTGEYSTGMIRSTLAAEPRRGAVLLAKAIVIALVMAATTVATYAVSLVITSPLVVEGVDWSDPAASIVPLMWGVVSMMAFTLIGVGFGFLIRSGAGAIATTVGVLFVLPIVFSMFGLAGDSWRWVLDAGAYLPSSAASTLTSPGADIVPSALALTGWVIAPLLLGWVALRTRDA